MFLVSLCEFVVSIVVSIILNYTVVTANSVVNRWCQTWDVPNVLIADGAPFPNTADKNPTLTIMALAMRTATHLLEELKAGNL